MSAYDTYLRRVLTQSSIYTLGPISGILTGLLSIVVLTRLLPIADYGRLSILLVFASLITLVCNLGIYQGANRAGFGTSDSDVIFPELDPEDGRRAAMGSGIVLTALVGLVLVLAVAPFTAALARLLLHDGSLWPAVLLAACEGAAAGVFRLSANVLRLERRPGAWAAVQATRPILALGGSVVFIELGYGLTGAAAGWVSGSCLSLLATWFVARRSFRFVFHWKAVGPLYVGGAPMIPVMLGFWIMGSGDVLVVSRVAPLSDVGRYRADARFGAFIYPLTQSFIYGWGTLHRDPVFAAAARERSKEEVDRDMVSYLAVVTLAAVTVLAVFAHQILYLVPSQYRAVELLLPLLGFRWAARGFLQAFFYLVDNATKRLDFGLVVLGAALVTMVAAGFLGARFGVFGVAAVVAAGQPLTFAVFAGVTARRGGFPRLAYGRVLTTLVVAAACVLGDRLLTPDSFLFGVGWLAAYIALLIALRVLPFERLAELAAALRPRRVPGPVLLRRVGALPPDERRVLIGFVRTGTRGGLPAAHPAELSLLARALRLVAGVSGAPSDTDEAIGRYVAWTGAPARRDAYANDLWKMGVEPAEVDTLVMMYRRLRRMRRGLTRLDGGNPPDGDLAVSPVTQE